MYNFQESWLNRGGKSLARDVIQVEVEEATEPRPNLPLSASRLSVGCSAHTCDRIDRGGATKIRPI